MLSRLVLNAHSARLRSIFYIVFILFFFSGRHLWGNLPVLAAPAERPLASPVPGVTIGAPSNPFIGSALTLTLTFDNTSATDTGYGPYIDLFLPLSGADGQNPPPQDDGISFVSANYLGASVTTQVLNCPAGGNVTHPLTGQTITCPAQPPGLYSPFVWQLVVITLPFGSFVPDQPPASVTVNAQLSTYADVGVALPIQARGGFMFGADPLDNPATDPPIQGSMTSTDVTPSLFTLEKSYLGPEDETATGPNFPRRYTVTATIAPGQTMTSFTLTDVLPNNMQFVSVVSTTPGGATCTTPSTTTPGGTLSCAFSGSVSGTVSMTFEYYIPLRDSGGASVIDPASGDDALSCNNASASGYWDAADPRDTDQPVSQDAAGCEHTLTDKSIAIQKSVNVVGGGIPKPGAILEYALEFQISDFFAFNGVVITDTISDGQHFDSSFAPTLEISGNTYTLVPAAFNVANYDVTCNYTGGPGAECTANDPAANDGTTTLTFRVSDEIISRGQDGRLIGGCVPTTGTGGSDPSCSSYNDGPTTGRIVFRTIIQENFTDTYPSGDASVDQGDVLNNTVRVAGNVLSTSDASTSTGNSEEDESAASVSIPYGTIAKSIYAINGSTSFSSPVHVKPGDTVTYRITYTLPTSDFEDLVITDYLPLPVFDATEVISFINAACGVPAAGVSCLGLADTYNSLPGAVTPTLSTDSTGNWVRWTYGDYDSTANSPSTIDLLFTVTVRNDPFADGLYLTNQAFAQEGSTNSSGSEATGIIQITLDEPALRISKGVVWTDNPNGGFTPSPVGPVTFDGSAVTCAGRLGGPINSSGLAANPVNSNLNNVDAADQVMMAIIIENTGHASAFDVRVRDSLPADMTYVSGSLCVTDGTGAPISYTDLGGGLFGSGIELDDPGPTPNPPGALDPGKDSNGNTIDNGRNIAVITYRVTLDSTVQGGQFYTNTATLFNYSNTEGGLDFTAEDPTDTAQTQIRYDGLGKTFTTEIINSYNSQTQVVIGEYIDYTLTITFHEGTTPNVTLEEQLPAGLAFVDCISITPSSTDLTTNLSGGFSAACNDPTNPNVSSPGQNFTFSLGTITNSNTDNSVDETLTIVFRAVTLNVMGNQSGTNLVNRATLVINGGAGGTATVQSAPATVIEPVVNTAKTVSPATADAGDTVTFTVTLSNPASGSTTAYDVTWSDVVPAGLTYSVSTLSGSCTTHALTLSDASAPTLTGSVSQLDPGETCTITFNATVDYSVTPGQVITNTAQTQWTSINGPRTDYSSYNGDSDERTGADGTLGSGVLNDYRTEGSATLTINAIAPQKFLLATSEAHTGVVSGTENVTIGEIVRYRLVVQLPEGTSPNFQIQDLLPTGLTYLDDGTARLALLSNGAPIASTEPTGSTLGLALGGGPFGTPPWVNGNDPTLVTPTFPLPDQNVGSSNSLTTDPDTYNTGSDPFFKLGTLTNNDNDADAEYVIIEFNALVDNTAIGSNDAGENRNNTFSVFINGTQNGPNSNTVTVRIAEPLLTLAKAVTIAPVDAGDPITYTLTISAASGDDRSTAFDLTLTDTLDPYFVIGSVNIAPSSWTCVGNGDVSISFSGNYSWGGSPTVVTVTANCLDPGQSITVTISGTVAANAPAGYTIPNTANLTWTSLPGTGTSPNPTGSTTPGGSGADNGERDGSGGINDYTASANANAPLAVPQIDKLNPVPAQYAIGQQVTFNILVTLPEGVTPALNVLDNLPAGLRYVSHQVITSAASSGDILAADYNGSFTNTPPTFTCSGACASGDDITLDFGNTTTNADNVTNNNAFLVQVVAVVVNEAGNQNGTTLTNTATVSWTGGSASDSVNVTVIEPVLTVDKIIFTPPSPPDAGGTVTYQVTIQHDAASTATAYDVNFTDALPAELTLNLASVTVTLNGGAAGATDNSAGNTVNVTIASIPLGGSVTIAYSATINSNVTPGQTVTNTGNLTWTSTAGANTEERNGNDGPGGALNDYAAADSASFDISSSAYDKTLESTSAAHTSGNALAIGEVATFGLYVTLPEGTTPSLTIVDDLPTGLEYVSGSAQVVTTVAGCGSLTADFNGSVPTPTITAPGGSGGDVTFQFSTITVTADNNPNNNTFVVCFNAVLLDEAGNQNGGTLTNNASFQIGSGPVTNDSTTVDVVEPELEILKAVSNPTPGVGQTFTYTLTIQHLATSAADAFDLIVNDPLPANLNRVAGPTWSDAPSGCAGTVTDTTAGDNIGLTVASLPLGCVLTVTYDAQVDAAASPGDMLTNTATLTWTSLPGSDPNERTGSGGVDDYADSASQTVTYTAVDLQITKDDGGITTTAGGVVAYTLNYTNAGNSVATGVVITETVPANTTFNAAASTAGWSCADGSPAGTICTFNIGTLNPGGSGSVTFAVNVNNPLPSGVTQISNTASIADDGTHGSDANPGDNSDSDTTPVDAAPDLTITKDDGLTVVSPGQTITYTLTISNVGTQDATGVVITDTIPANTTFVSASDGGTESGGVITWPTIALAANTSVTRTVTIRVNDPFPGTSILNQAHVEDDGANGSDPTPGNNDDDDTDTVLTLPNSDLTKSLIATNQGFTADPSVAIGEIVTYEVTFTVPAGGTMPNLTLTDVLDRGLAFVDCVSITPSSTDITTTLLGGFAAACNDPTNPTIATEPPGSTNPADPGRRVTFSLGDVSNSGASNGTVSIRYTAVVLDTIENQDGLSLNNEATLTWSSGSLTTSAPNVTIVEPDFELIKEADRTVAMPGSIITFTLTFRHTNLSNVDAFDVVLTDVLPPGLTYVPGSLTIVSGPPGGVTDDTAAPTLRVRWDTFPLLTGGSRTEAVVRFQAVLGNLLPGQKVRNTASLEWTSLPGDVSTPQSPYNDTSTERYYDPLSPVDVYGVQASVTITVPQLPRTGFAPGRLTSIPVQPPEKAYQDLGDLWLEIPKLGLKMPIVGVPAKGEEWDLTWLWDQAGWLEGTAYPTHAGNAALTAHVYLPNGEPGPFFNLGNLVWGDQIIVHLGGQAYIYEVRQVRQISPNSLSALRHEELPWLTLITCREYDARTNSYRYRVVVRAVLIKIVGE